MIEAKYETNGTKQAGHWYGQGSSLALDEQVVLVDSTPAVVKDSPGVYKLSCSQIIAAGYKIPYNLAQPRERSPIGVVIGYDLK